MSKVLKSVESFVRLNLNEELMSLKVTIQNFLNFFAPRNTGILLGCDYEASSYFLVNPGYGYFAPIPESRFSSLFGAKNSQKPISVQAFEKGLTAEAANRVEEFQRYSFDSFLLFFQPSIVLSLTIRSSVVNFKIIVSQLIFLTATINSMIEIRRNLFTPNNVSEILWLYQKIITV